MDIIEEIMAEFEDDRNEYIEKLMPETGTYTTEEKDCDENGNWGFIESKHYVNEDEALEEAQYALLQPENTELLDEFLFETDLREKILKYFRLKLKERKGW